MIKLSAMACAVLVGGSLMGCAAESSAPAPTPTPASGGSASSVQGTLTVNTSDRIVTGTYQLGQDLLTFESAKSAGGAYATKIVARGITLTTLVDDQAKTASFQGLATDGGGETALADADHALLVQFERALVPQLADAVKAGNGAADRMLRAATVWGDWPTTMKLQHELSAEQSRGWTSLCGSMYTAVAASWDDQYGGWWASNTTVYPYIGDYNGDGPTYWSNGTSWLTSNIIHASPVYEYGSCFGRCGGGCTGWTSGGVHVYTQDCTNHDACVRNNGHTTTDYYCNDQFASTTDDATFAGNCY